MDRTPTISDDELRQLWTQIESGSVSLIADIDPRMAAGNIHYRLPDGWQFVVFLDAGAFDYIDHVRAPDGRERDFHEIDGTPVDWHPPTEVGWRQLGFGRSGCLECGAALKPSVLAAPRYDVVGLCAGDRCAGTQNSPEGSTLRVELGWPTRR